MLRTRLLVFLGLLVAVVLAIGVSALWLFSSQADRMDRAVLDSYPSVIAAQEMFKALSTMQAAALQAIGGETNLARALFDQARRQFETNLALQFDAAALPGERELTDRLATNYSALLRSSIEVFNISDTNEQRRFNNEVLFPNVAVNTSLLNALRRLNHDALVAGRVEVQSIGRQATPLILGGMTLALALASLAYFHFRRRILKPIQAVTDATRAVRQGRLEHSVPVVTRDELGELAVAFNRMAAELREYRASTDEQLLKLNRTVHTTLASFPDPIFVLDQSGGIELLNPSAEELSQRLGWKILSAPHPRHAEQGQCASRCCHRPLRRDSVPVNG